MKEQVKVLDNPSRIQTQDKDRLCVIHEDNDFLIINKQAGLATHPGTGSQESSLASLLLDNYGNYLSNVGEFGRSGIVHRLDKYTSGLILVAKNNKSYKFLISQFINRTIERTYHALVWGLPCPPNGVLTCMIRRHPHFRKRMTLCKVGGRVSITRYKVISCFQTLASLVECIPETGRTHQLRVHLSSLGCGIIGDGLYGKMPRNLPEGLVEQTRNLTQNWRRPLLHAIAIRFIHPSTNKYHCSIAEIPQDLRNVVKILSTFKEVI